MNINWKELRIDYFNECVNNTPPLGSVTIPKIDMHPHNLFEWFKTKITNTANNNNKLVIGDVSKQRELLIAYTEYLAQQDITTSTYWLEVYNVDAFLKSNL